MSTPQERNCTGLLQPPPCGKQVKTELNYKETELRLGLPGSDSPERKIVSGVSLFGKDFKDENDNNGFLQSPLKGFVSGGKRCFYDAINGNGNWVSCLSNGSEAKTETNEVLFEAGEVTGIKNISNASGGVRTVEEKKNENGSTGPASKAQVVGWPPVRSFRKNTLASTSSKGCETTAKSGSTCLYVKVSMEGAPYLRKIDLKTYSSYAELSSTLEKMFSCFTIGQYGQGLAGKERLSESHLMDLLHGSEYVLTYEDKDGDWMLVGDVPWEMFTDSCKRLRIMKGSNAIGLAPRAMQKTKSQN